MFEYTHQPPSTTLEDCSPYSQNLLTMSLDCTVRYQTNEFEIKWFMEDTAGLVNELGHGEPDMSLGKIHWFSRYHINQQYNPSYLGKYWCQVINTTADPDQPLMRSNVFTLLAPENYTQPTCVNQTAIQRVKNVTCADHSEPQTTLLSALTTTTLSSYMSIHCSNIPDCTTISEDAGTCLHCFIMLLLFYRSYYHHDNSHSHHLTVIIYSIHYLLSS